MIDIVNLLTNNGIGIVCVAYLIYFSATTMKKISENQAKTNEILQNVCFRLENIEKNMKKDGDKND